ncbi:MAG: DISARM system SNF2-like helicase DrmD [Polyangiaceae bacterium]
MPRVGAIVQVRHRQWLVEDVTAPPALGQATRVRLVCLDDDHQGRALEVLWELELGARVLQPEAHGLGTTNKLDPPRHFAAYLHALKWNSVTATEARLFQAPFRAGIKLMNHQLAPLEKALSLPRANVFIADDVGLGKTIEAGLIAQELLLRQRVSFIVIVCPASVCLQWKDEMQRRFGLYFEVVNRRFIARRRQERGFGVNPWSTHTRFIVSHPILRRPEYRDPLLQHVGERVQKSLLILDEAHVAAPAGASRYAVDSRITDVVRDIAPRFENRLFLSATPHNGHSNSFSALLELLDPQRFTRGVPVRGRRQLDTVMVRRLKEDLRRLGVEQFPKRTLVELAVGDVTSPELGLASDLAKYTALVKPGRKQGALVFINLQKRLLSSVEAFYRTLQAHERGVNDPARGGASAGASVAADDDDEYGDDDEALDVDAEVAARSESQFALPSDATTSAHAKDLLASMLRTAAQLRGAPDAKAKALLAWIQKHQCAAVAFGGANPKAPKGERRWSDRRVLIFTEYGDTKRWLRTLLTAAFDGTDQGDQRILELHGGMGDEQRDEVQRAFNSPPGDHPVRVLLATDAAREGVNLQGHCADLFHFDIPWNPARIEQRNGRIDRTLQPAPEVRCHYFVYPDRAEDIVLRKLVTKVDVIQRELGSIGSVLLERFDEVLATGIDANTGAKLDAAESAGELKQTVERELDPSRAEALAKLKEEIDDAGDILNRSAKIMDFDPLLLRDAIDVGLELTGAGRLERVKTEDAEAWTIPPLPQAWQETLDTLRPARGRDEPLWDYRKKPPNPVVFRPPAKMNSALSHLHLHHPFVRRLLGRFISQGYSAHDLSRVTVVRTRHDALVRVIAFGRLSLFGPGATRLHDKLVSVAARWIDGKEQDLKPFAEEADRKAIRELENVLAEAPSLEAVSATVQAKLAASAPLAFAALWPHIRVEADSDALEAETKLRIRGAEEADALRGSSRPSARTSSARSTAASASTSPCSSSTSAKPSSSRRRRRTWTRGSSSIEREIETELRADRSSLYKVALRRLEPVGSSCLPLAGDTRVSDASSNTEKRIPRAMARDGEADRGPRGSIPVLVDAQCMERQPPEVHRTFLEQPRETPRAACSRSEPRRVPPPSCSGFTRSRSIVARRSQKRCRSTSRRATRPCAQRSRSANHPRTSGEERASRAPRVGPAAWPSTSTVRERDGDVDYPPSAKFDRLLRHCRVPIGLLTNREVVRLVYAPHGESSGRSRSASRTWPAEESRSSTRSSCCSRRTGSSA